MSDFSGRTPKKVELTIDQDGFFPVLSVGDFQEQHRVPSDWREEAIKTTLLEAMMFTNESLNTARILAINALKKEKLVELELKQIAGKSELVRWYESAVFNEAKSRLLKSYPTMNRRDQAKHEGREDEEQHDHYHNVARESINLLNNKIINLCDALNQCSAASIYSVRRKVQSRQGWRTGRSIRARTI